MQVEKIDLRSTNSFSNFFLDYIDGKRELDQFYHQKPEVGSFEEQIKEKQFSVENRQILCQVLDTQYQNINKSIAVQANLSNLKNTNTYTVTTGHQLNIFTGSLYFIYKIATAVNACKTLKEKYSEADFVPIYWMASEDHDFEEISYFNLFGKRRVWENDEKGAVGRFSNKGLDAVLEEIPEAVDIFEKAYREHNNLADAVRYYVNELFGEWGVVVVDADHSELKTLFSNVIKDDLLHGEANQLVEQTNVELEAADYKPQIFSREINFFYLQYQSRERIIKEGESWKVNNTDISFSESELLEELEANPERFSPNVVMRPLYQETILPNLAYVGGSAEVVYWMQLKRVFENYNILFPVLLPRNFAMYINGGSAKKMAKFELSNQDLFKSGKELKQEYLAKHAENEVSLNGEVDDLKQVYDILMEKAGVIDGSLKGLIASEYVKASKGLGNIGKRLKKAEESKHETSLNQLVALKERLFPNGGLQERHDNFLNFYINNPAFVKQIIEGLDPFDIKMHVLTED